jgi:hypothetical protein
MYIVIDGMGDVILVVSEAGVAVEACGGRVFHAPELHDADGFKDVNYTGKKFPRAPAALVDAARQRAADVID